METRTIARMINRRTFSYLRHLPWYLYRSKQIPLCSDLNACLPLPNLEGVMIHWPTRYRWPIGAWRLDLVRDALAAYVPIQRRELDAIDAPGPDLFEAHCRGRTVRCAWDYSDYPVISTESAAHVDCYFKCIAPLGPLPAKVVSVGYFPRNVRLMAKARSRLLRGGIQKDIAVYGRFGTWTRSQAVRARIVERVRQSQLPFVGGFGTRVYAAYMKELLRAKIVLEVPGNGPITYRLPEAMALGAAVVATPPGCAFPEPLLDGIHYVAIKDDASNVVEVCQALLDDNARRQQIATNAMTYFDRNFSPQSLARRILRHATAQPEER